MIRQAAFGVGRLLFGASLLLLLAAAGVAYVAYRAVRFATVGSKPQPVRDAGFAVLLSVAELARTIQHEQRSRL